MVDFDPNFHFPIPSVLENDRVKLIPWNPTLHSSIYVRSIAPHPELFNYMPFGPFASRDTFDPWFEGRILESQAETAFAIFDKSREGEDQGGFAGMIGLLNASPENLSIELGHLIILPAFQRTHVSSNAVGLLLHWALDLPSTAANPTSISGGLGLRRVYWSANTQNTRSVALAQRLGLRLEAILRWDRVLPVERVAFAKKEQLREGDPRRESPGRDTARLAICWDDWVNGGRERVDKEMQRVN